MAALNYQLDFRFDLLLRTILTTQGRGSGSRKGVIGSNRGLLKRFGSGYGLSQLDKAYFRNNPTAIAASGNQDFDLAASLADDAGATITFVKVFGIVVFNWNTAGSLSLTRPASNGLATMFIAASDGVIVGAAADAEQPGIGMIWSPGGAAVTAGTGDLINLINNDATNAADYTIGIFGRSV